MTYVQIRPKGTRLGNWMFQYAAAKSASPDDAVTFVIEDRTDWPKVEKFRALFLDVSIVDHAPEGAIVRTDLYQDVKFLSPVVVAGLFECPDEIREKLESDYGNLLKDTSLVSVHVRRGDYLKLPHRHPFVGKEYLKNAIAKFKAVPGAKFMVCSDDIPWCRRFFNSKSFPNTQFYFSDGVSVLEDLFLMRSCKGGHICSNSTFSWWGAYGSSSPQPMTIFPSMWYGFAVHEDWRGLYFDGAKVVANRYSAGRFFAACAMMARTWGGEMLRRMGIRR